MYMKELTIQDIETIVRRDENRVMEAKETTGELVKGMQSGCAFLGGQGTGTCPNASYDNMEDQYTFDYPANKIIETWKYTNGETGTQIYSVKYNDRGYITVFDTDYEEDGYATSEKNSFNYDSESHMSSCSLYGVIDRIKDGERLYLDWNLKVTFDWKDGLLQYMTFDGEETENETKSSVFYKYKYSYDADFPNISSGAYTKVSRR